MNGKYGGDNLGKHAIGACLQDSKGRTESLDEGVRVYVSERSETKEQIPSAPPVLFRGWRDSSVGRAVD